jgi:hypothetical protein
MIKTGKYILISLFLFLITQSLLAYAVITDHSCQSLEFPKNINPAGTETSNIILHSWSDDDLFVSDLFDDEDETWPTVRKNKSTTLKENYNLAQYVFTQYYSVAPHKYELPCSHHLATPYFISFRELRI